MEVVDVAYVRKLARDALQASRKQSDEQWHIMLTTVKHYVSLYSDLHKKMLILHDFARTRRWDIVYNVGAFPALFAEIISATNGADLRKRFLGIVNFIFPEQVVDEQSLYLFTVYQLIDARGAMHNTARICDTLYTLVSSTCDALCAMMTKQIDLISYGLIGEIGERDTDMVVFSVTQTNVATEREVEAHKKVLNQTI